MCNLCQLIYKYLKYNNGDYIDDQGGLPKVWVVGDHLFFLHIPVTISFYCRFSSVYHVEYKDNNIT